MTAIDKTVAMRLLKNANRYIKKPIPVRAIQLAEDVDVHTMEGVFHASAGDYLIEGVKGEIYSCNREIFEQTYELFPVDGKIREVIDRAVGDE